jgi:hypothetical protein
MKNKQSPFHQKLLVCAFPDFSLPRLDQPPAATLFAECEDGDCHAQRRCRQAAEPRFSFESGKLMDSRQCFQTLKHVKISWFILKQHLDRWI